MTTNSNILLTASMQNEEVPRNTHERCVQDENVRNEEVPSVISMALYHY